MLGSLAVHLFLLSAQISPSFWQEKDERAEQKRKNKGWPHWSGLNQRTLAPNADVVTTAPWGFVVTLAALNFVYGNSAELFSLANRIEVFFGTEEARQTSTTVLKCSINFVSHFFSLAGERRKKKEMVPLVRLEPSDFGSDGQSLNRCTTWSFVVTCSTEQRLYTSYVHEFIYSVDLRYGTYPLYG